MPESSHNCAPWCEAQGVHMFCHRLLAEHIGENASVFLSLDAYLGGEPTVHVTIHEYDDAETSHALTLDPADAYDLAGLFAALDADVLARAAREAARLAGGEDA